MAEELGGQGLGEHLDEAVVDGDHHVPRFFLNWGRLTWNWPRPRLTLQPGEQASSVRRAGLGQLQVVIHQLDERAVMSACNWG